MSKFRLSARPSMAIRLLGTILIAVAIFAIDTFTPLDVAAAVLYVVVVLLSVSFLQRRGVILVCAGCMGLTMLSYVLTAGPYKEAGLLNTIISLLAVTLTTYLAIKIEAVTRTTKALAETDQLRNAVIGSVSHELRTPLASILGGVSILAETSAISKDGRLSQLVKGIRDEAIRLNSDIQNLLDAARITGHGLQALSDWTDAKDIIDAAVERVSVRYPERKLEMLLDDNLPLLRVDPALVEQALGQIISNAAKFSPADSKITIAAHVEDERLVISVTDSGVGLTEEEKIRFAERFFRGRRHTGKIPGSGLGMWIAKTFIVSNGGTIEALSLGEQRGTTVRVILPVPFHDASVEKVMQESATAV